MSVHFKEEILSFSIEQVVPLICFRGMHCIDRISLRAGLPVGRSRVCLRGSSGVLV